MNIEQHFIDYCWELSREFQAEHSMFIYFLTNPFLYNFVTMVSLSGKEMRDVIDSDKVKRAKELFLESETIVRSNNPNYLNEREYLQGIFGVWISSLLVHPIKYKGVQIGVYIAAAECDEFFPSRDKWEKLKERADGMMDSMDELLKDEEICGYINFMSGLKPVLVYVEYNKKIPVEYMYKWLGGVIDMRKLFVEVYYNGVHYWHLSEINNEGEVIINMLQEIPCSEKRLTDNTSPEHTAFNINVPVMIDGEHSGNIRIETFIGACVYLDNITRVIERASMDIVRILPGFNWYNTGINQ